MIVDYHLHTLFSRHASGSIDEYLARAHELGDDEVCFTEHSSREYLPEDVRAQIPWTWMQIGELPSYLEWLRSVDRTAPIPVRRGLEVDYFAGYDESIRQYLQAADVDFVLGSIHFLPQYGMQYVSLIQDEPIRFLLTYFDIARQAAQSGVFDSIAHLHLGWQGVLWPEDPAEGRLAEEALADVVKAAKASDTCLEINTRAFAFEGCGTLARYCCFLQLVADFGVPVTIGSDAHSPKEVGRNYPQVIATLRQYGIDHVAVFRQRQRRLVPLGELAARSSRASY